MADGSPAAPAGEDSPDRTRLAPQPPTHAGVERFDDSIVVVRARAWLGLGACLLLLAGLVVWAVTAEVPAKVTLQGLAARAGVLETARSPVAGTIERIDVRPGQRVRPGQKVATVGSPDGATHPVVALSAGRVIDTGGVVGSPVLFDEAVVIMEGVGPMMVSVFPTPDDAALTAVGTKALIGIPAAGGKGTQLDARVSEVALLPSTAHEVAERIGDSAVAAILAPKPPVQYVGIAPAKAQSLRTGMIVPVTLILDSKSPIDYVF